jgi:hypothetical protein
MVPGAIAQAQNMALTKRFQILKFTGDFIKLFQVASNISLKMLFQGGNHGRIDRGSSSANS